MIACLTFNPVLADDVLADEGAVPPALGPSFNGERSESRPLELHRVQNLTAGDSISTVSGRRSLSADERRALHRELRNAMKGAYPDDRGTR